MAFKKVPEPPAKREGDVKAGWILEVTENDRKSCALFTAIKSKCARKVETALRTGVDVDRTISREKITAVHQAVILNCADIVEVLIDNGADVNIPDSGDTTPLISAMKQLHAKVREMPFITYCDLWVSEARKSIPPENQGQTIDILKQLLKAGANPLHADGSGKSAFDYETSSSPSLIDLLLSNGGDINARDKHSMTMLIFSIKTGNIEMLKKLLEAGADPLVWDSSGKTALHYASSYSLETVDLLLPYVVYVNVKDNDGITPLMCAVEEDKIEIVKELLNAGAGIMTCDKSGNNALHYAARHSLHALELLLSKGVGVNVIGRSSRNIQECWSPLMVAADAGNLSTLLLLLHKGAAVNLRSSNMKTALHFAHTCRVAEILCEWGAEITAIDIEGNTPLQSAMLYREPYNRGLLTVNAFAQSRNIEVVETLLTINLPSPDYESFIRDSGVFRNPIVNLLLLKLKQAFDEITFTPDDFRNIVGTSRYDTRVSYYLAEVQRMKETKPGRLSLFHVLIRKTNYRFAANNELCGAIENKQFEKDFPVYHKILRSRLRIAKWKYSLLCSSVEKLSLSMQHFQNILIPEEICLTILSNLSITDLCCFNRAFNSDFYLRG